MRHRSGFASESFMRSVIARAWSCHGAPPSSSAAALAFAPLPEINDAACSPEIGVTPKPSSDTRPAKKPLSHTRCSGANAKRSEEHTSELQSHSDLVCRLLLEKKKNYRSRSLCRATQTSSPLTTSQCQRSERLLHMQTSTLVEEKRARCTTTKRHNLGDMNRDV